MKAKMEASCVERESRRAVAVLLDGGVVPKKNARKYNGGVHSKRGEENTEEMREYLGKLQELVPFMPKNKKLSKLEVISHVIDYIHDLRGMLGLSPCQQSDMDYLADEHDIPTISHSQLVSNQTFKVSLVRENSTSSNVSSAEPHCDIPPTTTTTVTSPPSARVPLSTISTPRNTDDDDMVSNNSTNIIS